MNEPMADIRDPGSRGVMYDVAMDDVTKANECVDYIRCNIGELTLDQALRVQSVVLEMRRASHVQAGLLLPEHLRPGRTMRHPAERNAREVSGL